jgi:UDP-4-amino-4,6-dideoxy-N-acetyl-beta-L-altrosamine transaminase
MLQIPYGRHNVSDDDIQAVVEVLRSENLTQGPAVPKFEERVAEYCAVQYAVAVNSATSALHIACLALGVKSGDVVWTTPISFVASANAARYCGANIDFVDIDPITNNISVKALEAKLRRASTRGVLPKVVIPVHFSGLPCEMREIHALGETYGFKIIEDASHAIGGTYAGGRVGACEYSDITVFSFHPVKIITTAEGGMALTKSGNLADKMRLLRSHGISRSHSDEALKVSNELWNYKQTDLGYNYRMTDLQAALGISQLSKIETFIAARRDIHDYYHSRIGHLPIRLPHVGYNSTSALHLYVIRLDQRVAQFRNRVYARLIHAGIQVNFHYIPIYLHPYYRALGFSKGYCPEAERYFSDAISIPIFPGLGKNLQDRIITELESALKSEYSDYPC